MQYQEVIKFACNLTGQSDLFLDIIYSRLIVYLNTTRLYQNYRHFLQSLGKELSEKMKFDMFHNKYFNHTTTEDPRVHIPSRFYRFDNNTPEHEAVCFEEEGSVTFHPFEAHCSISVSSKSLLTKVLKVLQKIQTRIRVVVTSFDMLDESLLQGRNAINAADSDIEETKLLKNTLKLSPSAVFFHLNECCLSQPAYKYIAQQLNGCQNLQSLCLDGIRQMTPVNLGESIATMTSLRYCNMERSRMTCAICQKLMLGLSKCFKLEVVSFVSTKLTDSIANLFNGPLHYKFESLQTLYLIQGELTENDIGSLGNAVKHSKLPHLKHLSLSSNRLTNILKKLIPHEARFPFLEMLSLEDTGLAQNDIASLSQAIRLNKIPKLKTLDIARNRVSGCIKHLFRESNQLRFTSLETLSLAHCSLKKTDLKRLCKVFGSKFLSNCKRLNLAGNVLAGILGEMLAEDGLRFIQGLNLDRTKLNKDDLQSLSQAIEQERLPRLAQLSLNDNNFRDVEGEIKHLFKVCAEYFRKTRMEILMSLNDVSNPEEFKNDINSLCMGTKVSMNWRQVTDFDGQRGRANFGFMQSFSLKPGVWYRIPVRFNLF